jgi:hypothetical protein
MRTSLYTATYGVLSVLSSLVREALATPTSPCYKAHEMNDLTVDFQTHLDREWQLRAYSGYNCVDPQLPDRTEVAGVVGPNCVQNFGDVVYSFLFIGGLPGSKYSITPCPGDKCGPDAEGNKCCELLKGFLSHNMFMVHATVDKTYVPEVELSDMAYRHSLAAFFTTFAQESNLRGTGAKSFLVEVKGTPVDNYPVTP